MKQAPPVLMVMTATIALAACSPAPTPIPTPEPDLCDGIIEVDDWADTDGERALSEAHELLGALSDSELAIYPGPIADALRSARRAMELPVGGSTIAMEALDVAAALCRGLR
ncbi:MAG: hypothetical protein OXL97_11765 [Chloroflexota bacterium]|nr:hypothetical protein [Chloroflexota bacterium]MDE2884645.1 hypothetical protein [Chloroflexota bacterium]